jgi:hypothetical protein
MAEPQAVSIYREGQQAMEIRVPKEGGRAGEESMAALGFPVEKKAAKPRRQEKVLGEAETSRNCASDPRARGVMGERGRAREANRKGGEVDRVEADPSPTSPVPEFGRRSVRAGRRCGGVLWAREREGVRKEESATVLTDRSIGPTWSG